ncbi:hypothetical protein Pla123a_43530 [Posidoniimonas polymericola]|uniref:Uncharacterized protein n=1 Tax=Posidoniimonas polymericola TaxID=2528002 RepID=A0A5C5XVK0_9BACT|nr:hypothetical protein Pla123a_43530 [Posidoniimonas polymericola]
MCSAIELIRELSGLALVLSIPAAGAVALALALLAERGDR